MKRLKSIWVRLLVISLSIAMIIGCFGGVVLAAPSGESIDALHASGEVPSKVMLGETFYIPAKGSDASVTVKAPNGETVTSSGSQDGKTGYRATDIGNYTIEYARGEERYCYILNCYEEQDYFIYVVDGGAAIPTYIGSGSNFVLPEWCLAYTDDNGKLVKVDNTVKTVMCNQNEITPNESGEYRISFAEAETGTYTLTLSAGFNAKKMYSAQYVINVQSNFVDTKNPTLKNIANMPATASVRAKVDLPKASAEDDYDKNVLVSVEVLKPDGKTKVNVVNDDKINAQGYAEEESNEPVRFDNDRVTSFYPMETGTYTVTYYATDDAGNTSAKHEYKIAVSDKSGPVFTDIDESAIPNVWGLEKVRNGEGKESGSVVYLPIPEIADNSDEFKIESDGNGGFTGSGNINLSVEIKNPNTTVARFDRLTPATIAMADKSTENRIDENDDVYGRYFKKSDDANDCAVKIVNHDGVLAIELDFNDFYSGTTTGEKSKAGIVGTWTVIYEVRDASGNGGYNNSRKTYTINVKEIAFTDNTAPEIDIVTLPKYLAIGGEETEYTVPAIEASDDNDARLKEDYNLVCNGNRLAVKSGETLKIVERDGQFYFENEDGKTLELSGSEIEFEYTAIDDFGNSKKLLTDDEKNYSLKIYRATEAGFTQDNIDFEINENTLEAGTSKEQYLGKFSVNEISQLEFVGFELAVTDKNNDPIDVSAHMYFTDGDVKALHVENIVCNLAKEGDYLLTVRIFDAKGNSCAFAKMFNAEKVSNTSELNGKAAAVAWENSGSVGKAYSLKRETFTVTGQDNIGVYEIEGGKFSMLGYDFTPLERGSYTITEKYGVESEFNADGFDADRLTINSVYGMTATESQSVKYDVLGIMPSYLKKYETPEDTTKYQEPEGVIGSEDYKEFFYVTNPFVAYSDGVNYDVELTYTKPNGNNSSNTANKVYEYTDENGNVKYTFDKDAGTFFGRFALVLDADGTYTITVKAVGVSDSGKTYTLKVGDVIKPTFRLDTANQDKRVGDKFEYKEFEYVPNNDDSDDEIYVSYRLIEPGSGTVVSAVSATRRSLTSLISKSGSNNTIKLEIDDYEFTRSGDYEVEIEFEDAAGNITLQKYTISVNATASSNPTSLTMLSTVLIIIGVLLILGVIVYFIRFRKRRA